MADSRLETKEIVLMTGASGLIGSRLTRVLEDQYTVVGLDIAPPSNSHPATHHVDLDLTQDASVQQALATLKEKFGSSYASVIHLAAYYDFSGEPSPLYNELTVEGTRRLLQGLQEFEFQVEQFVFSSSLLVMQPTDDKEMLSENSPTEAEWAYPQSKIEAEKVIHNYSAQFPSVILRLAGVYDEQCHSLPISQQIVRIDQQQLEAHVFPGDSSHGQALVHLDDLADCFLKVVQKRNDLENETLLLIAEPDVMSYQELQDRIGELIHGSEITTIRIPKVVAKAGAQIKNSLSSEENQPFIQPWMIDLADDHYAADISRANALLGWNPEHSLRNTLPTMIDFLKRDPQSFYHENKLPLPEELRTSDPD